MEGGPNVEKKGLNPNRRSARKEKRNELRKNKILSEIGSVSTGEKKIFHIEQPGSVKRTRRKPRKKSEPTREIHNKQHIAQDLDLIDFECQLTIKAISSQTSGHFIRKRNETRRKIQLKTFKIDSTPCVFITNKLVRSLQKLSVNDNNIDKMRNRKFYNKDNKQTPSKKQNEPGTSQNNSSPQKRQTDINERFTPYYTPEQVKTGLESNTLVQGSIRINPKMGHEAYVSNKNTSLNDYYIVSVADRNRALEGDEVVLEIKPRNQWVDGRATCRVVFIAKKVHTRLAIGHLKMPEPKNVTPDSKNRRSNRKDFAIFYPRDRRLPFIRVHKETWPKGFNEKPKMYEKNLFMVEILQWEIPKYALGIVRENIGLEGDLKVEELSILKEYNLDPYPHNPKLVESMNLPKNIDDKEFEYRLDLRKDCIFTIDPLTARDLDDAVSVEELPNGNYKIGVHISDVAYYLKDGSPLDVSVAKKATTIYMVNNVYHMLPKEMCFHCSLLPGTDKCAFSVFWEMTPESEIVHTSFARTVINSSVQLAYEHAQMMIEDPDREFKDGELPTIHNNFTSKDLSRTVNILQKIAIQLKQKRIQNGALKINQVKLSFKLDPANGDPQTFFIYENKEAHRLIEEFMLLANISVAEKINGDFPDVAFLRCHEPPKQTMMDKLQKNLEVYGIFIDISNAGSISSSLKKYIGEDEAGFDRCAVLYHLFSKPMTRARYFCASEGEDYRHFALSVPLYTHFTSPIRRYADIMVHRLLAASLGYCDSPQWDVDYVAGIAANCNGQKYNAKRAGESSSELYLACYIEKHQPFIEDAVVVDVKDKSFDAIVTKTGSIVRIYKNTLPDGSEWTAEPIKINTSKEESSNDMTMYKVTIKYPKTKDYQEISLIIELFTHVKVSLNRKKQTYKLDATLLRPV
ncbi:unnamed protein product [Brassicogethes aeneus]|uniref:RNB domain-containing protein n=1 Tax=Brassicogethes aeneus TaxID=1431903 RepID=A0A9P0BDK2_BRAAE|nr:unnamed protein product [Brassicogethes aeneus]